MYACMHGMVCYGVVICDVLKLSMYACMHVCTHMYVRACACTYVYYIYIHIYIHTHTHLHLNVSKHMYTAVTPCIVRTEGPSDHVSSSVEGVASYSSSGPV